MLWQGAEGQQLQALTALQGLARGSKQWSTVSFAAVQSAFREAGGFPLLVNLIATARSPRSALPLLAWCSRLLCAGHLPLVCLSGIGLFTADGYSNRHLISSPQPKAPGQTCCNPMV